MSFYIRTPDNKKVELYYRNKYTDLDKKKELLNDFVLDKYENYFEKFWMSGKTKYTLNQCGNFLLLNESKEGKILSDYKTKQVHNNEKPVSSQSFNIHDYLYSSIYDIRMDNVKVSNLSGEQNNSSEESHKDFKESRTYKLNKLYSREGIDTYRIVKV